MECAILVIDMKSTHLTRRAADQRFADHTHRLVRPQSAYRDAKGAAATYVMLHHASHSTYFSLLPPETSKKVSDAMPEQLRNRCTPMGDYLRHVAS